MQKAMNYDADGRLFVSETDDSLLIYDRGSGDIHYLKDKNELETAVERIKSVDEKASSFVRLEKDTVKINLSNVCNLNCDYCFRDKINRVETNVETAKKIIDFVVDELRPGAEYYSFSVNLTSEALVELDKLKKIKEYLDEKLYPFFTEKQFKSIEDVEKVMTCIPKALTIAHENPVFSVNGFADFMNSLLDRKDLSSFFPLPPGMVLPDWEAKEIAKVNELEGYALRLCNMRFLEALFPETFIRKPCYVMTICTNGTLFSQEIVEFLKSINVDCVNVSLDGPKAVHDCHRKDYAGNPSYDIVTENIRKFKDAGFSVSVAAVMTPDYPHPLEIVEHLQSLGVSGISINPVRAGSALSFDEESMDILLLGYKKLFEKLLQDVKKNDYSLVNLLKNDTSFIGIQSIFSKIRMSKRCNWNEILIFDGKGDIYPCDYFIGKKEFLRGKIGSKEIKDIDEEKIQIDLRGNCKNCWCKYMCGGTCFYNSYVNEGSISAIDKVECKFTKGLRTLCLEFIHQLLDAGINIENFAKMLNSGYDENLDFDKKFEIKNGIFVKFEGTLTKIEMKFKEFYEKFAKKGVVLNPEFYITIGEIKDTKRSKLLYGTAIVPIEAGLEKLKDENCLVIQNFDFGNCVAGRCSSRDEAVSEMKTKILKQVRGLMMPIVGGMWLRGTLDAFLGYRDEEVDVFVQLNPGVF